MKKVIAILSVLAMCGLVMGACGSSDSGPSCKAVVTCDPVCNTTTQWCDSGTCKDFIACDPPTCAGDGTDYCNPIDGTCWKVCTPACKTDGTEACDKNGTCQTVEVVVCDPPCKTDGTEYCSK